MLAGVGKPYILTAPWASSADLPEHQNIHSDNQKQRSVAVQQNFSSPPTHPNFARHFPSKQICTIHSPSKQNGANHLNSIQQQFDTQPESHSPSPRKGSPTCMACNAKNEMFQLEGGNRSHVRVVQHPKFPPGVIEDVRGELGSGPTVGYWGTAPCEGEVGHRGRFDACGTSPHANPGTLLPMLR